MKYRFNKFTRFKTRISLGIGLLFIAFIFIVTKVCLIPQGNRFSTTDLNVFEWFNDSETYCNGNYIGYAHRFLELKSTVYDPSEDVFAINCNFWTPISSPKWYWFHTEFYAQGTYTKTLQLKTQTDLSYNMDAFDIVFIVHREYPHNFFHAMTQWYNLFILSKKYGVDMKNMTILLLDRSPRVHLDEQWSLLFRQIFKAGDLRKPVFIKNAIFNIAGHESPMYYFDLYKLPFIEEFTSHFLGNFNLTSKQTYDCDHLKITLVFRRDYFMYPGVSEDIRIVERKFRNEDEIINTFKSEFHGHTLNILIAEDMSLPDQLALTTNSDVLIAMHGCVLTQTFFLPKHAIVLEMFPNFWKIQRFFSSIAKWRNINHNVWHNPDDKNEFDNHYTYIPKDVLINFAGGIREHFACNNE